MDNPIVTFALRGAQALFAIVTLGLSVNLLKGQVEGMPAIFGYGAFVGGISFVGALVGVASVWVELLQGIIGAGIDAVVLLANIAGGIIIAYKVRGIDCNGTNREQSEKILRNDLINRGCDFFADSVPAACLDWSDGKYRGRCKENQADSAFMFLTAVVTVATITFILLRRR